MINRRIVLGLSTVLLAVVFIGCDQRESTATPAPAASAEQSAAKPAEPSASAKMDDAVEAAKVAAAKTGEATQILMADASDKARETAAEAKAKAGEALDLAGQAASDIATDLKKGASEAMENWESAVDKAGESAREVGAKAADKTEKALSGAADKAKGVADGLRTTTESSSSSTYTPGLTMEFLAHQKFTLWKVNEADYHHEQVPYIEFDGNSMISGKVCNTFRGPAELSGGVLTAKSLVATKMLCPVNGLDELETRLFAMLDSGAEISMNGSRLMLKQGGTILVFEADTKLAE